MAVRQYVGARYVPKFFEWSGSSEWVSGVAYEALTIVTRNGNSYTSKIPVPSNIGAPESNPDYWVSTGIYNEQVESIRQLASGTAETLSGFMSDGAIGTDNLANGAVATVKINAGAVGTSQLANGAVTTDKLNNTSVTTEKLASGAVTTEKIANNGVTTDKINDNAITVDKIAPRYVINVGDSYQAGYEPSGGNSGWGAYLFSMFGYSGHNIPGVGGAGFGATAGSQYDLANILASNPPSNIDYDKVTDIVVGCGYNDFKQTVDNIEAGILRFYNHCKTTYPNAKIWLAPIGWAWTNNENHIVGSDVGRTYTKYMQLCKNLQINFINSCLGILLGCNGMNTTDYKHPTEAGNKAIACAINAAFNGLPYMTGDSYYELTPTGTGFSGKFGCIVSTINGTANIRISAQSFAYSGTEFQAVSKELAFAHHPFMCLFREIIAPVIKCDSKYYNAPVSFAVDSDSTCHLAFEVINDAGTGYLPTSAIQVIGTRFQETVNINLANA